MPHDAARLRQPVRLLRRSGQWQVELTRLVSVDEQLMRPERYQLVATPEVLRRLTPSCPPERVREAEALLRTPDDGSECAFELAEHGWAPLSESPPSLHPLTRNEMMALIGELQAQVTLMRGMHDALLARIVTVEATLQPKAESPKPGPRPLRKVPSRRDMLAVLQGPANDRPGPLALDGLRAGEPAPAPVAAAPSPTPAPMEAAAKPPAPAADATKLSPPEPLAARAGVVAAPAADAAAARVLPRLLLPEQSDVIQCLRMLASDVEVSPQAAPVPTDFTDYYVARLVDAAQETLGAILVNQRAGAALGGGLLGIPLAARDEQGRRGIAKDTLEGLNEICNNVWGLVNRKNPQTPTKLCALERVSGATSSWLPSAPGVLTLATPGNGSLYLATR
jgi:hypothetical protein